MKKSKSSISEVLRIVRICNDLSIQELADQLGVSKSYISQIESAKKTPSDKLLEHYSEIFGIPMSHFKAMASKEDYISKFDLNTLILISKLPE